MACQSSDTETNELADENLSFLEMELEALESIFINELEVMKDENFTTVSIDLYPSTADKLDEQYVRVTLQLILSEEYPEEIPDIKIRNPRGLSEEELDSIIQDLHDIAESKKGNSMLFEMIDATKEHLTVGNRPSGECSICLHIFSDNDVFTKTECYHYFHSHCLARYAKNFFENLNKIEEDAENKSKSEELLCPMCRLPIEFDDWDADYPPPEGSDESCFTPSEEMIELQKKMSVLFQKQVQKGGIIDIEAEKNKYLLEISDVPTRTNNEETPEQNFAAEEIPEEIPEDDSVIDSKIQQYENIDKPACDKKDYAKSRNRSFENLQPEGSSGPASDRKDYIKGHNRNFDYRGKNKNFNRPNESRTNNKYDERYDKQSYAERYNKQSYSERYNKQPYGERYNKQPYGERYNNQSYGERYNRQPYSERYNRQPYSERYNRQPYSERYNRQSFNHGNYNKSGYRKQNSENSYQDECRNLQNFETKDNPTKTEEDSIPNSSDVIESEDVSETSDYPSPNSKPKYNNLNSKQSFNRGNYNKYRYRKQNSENSYRNESRNLQHFETKDNATKSEDSIHNSSDMIECEDVSETSDYPPPNSKPKYNNSNSKQSLNHRNYNKYENRKQNSGNSYRDESRNLQNYETEDNVTKSEDSILDSSDMIVYDDVSEASDYPPGNTKHKYNNPNKKQHSKNSYQDESRNFQSFETDDNVTKSEDSIHNSSNMIDCDDASETFNYPSPNSKPKYNNPNFSPRYKNRRFHEGRNNYNYDYGRRSDKPSYNEQKNSHTSHRYSLQRAEDSSGKFEKAYENNYQGDNNYKSNYRSDNYKHGYNAKQRYPDNKNSFQRNFKGAYNGRDDYSNSYNSKSNRYTDSKDRDQYSERNHRDNYREKGTNRDMKYKNDDAAHNRSRQSTRNYTERRPESYPDKSYVKVPSKEPESLELSNQDENKDCVTSQTENGGSDICSNLSPKEKSLPKDLTDSTEKSPKVVSAFSSSLSNSFPNAFSENSDIIPRTVNPPPGFANPLKKVVYGLQGANPPPGFNRS